MDSQRLKATIITALTIFVALWLGLNAATAQLETVAWVLGCSTIAICTLLGSRVYLVIPFMSALALVLPLPGGFSTGFIGQALFISFAVLLLFIKKLKIRIQITELEIWIVILSTMVLQSYIRNPVGLSILGTETVGAKPYAQFGASVITATILSSLLVDPKDLRLWTYLTLAGSLMNFAVGAMGFLFPSVGYILAASFTTDYTNKGRLDTDSFYRISFVKSLSQYLPIWISSRKSPLFACFHPLWCPLVLTSIALGGMSGYRAQIVLIGLIYFVGICYRGGIRSVFVACIGGALSIVFLSIVNSIAPLPLNIQRSLSILPGSWQESAGENAKDSTDWRVEIWEEALFTEHWIKNKWLGDGLGLSRDELNRIREFELDEKKNRISRLGLTHQQESYLINGNYHSGPVHTVRTIGYIGLTVLIVAMFRLGVHTHREIKRCRGTAWYPTAIFLGIPLIAMPLHWLLVIGTFESATVNLMLGIAVVRMMQKNLPLPKNGANKAVLQNPPIGSNREDDEKPAPNHSRHHA